MEQFSTVYLPLCCRMYIVPHTCNCNAAWIMRTHSPALTLPHVCLVAWLQNNNYANKALQSRQKSKIERCGWNSAQLRAMLHEFCSQRPDQCRIGLPFWAKQIAKRKVSNRVVARFFLDRSELSFSRVGAAAACWYRKQWPACDRICCIFREFSWVVG